MVETKSENKLEKKASKEVGNIWKTYIPYVPFGFMGMAVGNNFEKYHGSTSKTNGIGLFTSLVNPFLTGTYLLVSLGLGTLNPIKWSEISEKNEIKSKIELQNKSYEIFKKYDLNKDDSLSPKEFLNYKIKNEK